MTERNSETTTRSLREEACAIWTAGVEAVKSERLVRQNIQVEGDQLRIVDQTFSLDRFERIIVVGAGKAGAGMAEAVEAQLGSEIVENKLSGWVNVPDNCVRSLKKIQLFPARPAGLNEPTPDGVIGSEAILNLVHSATEKDLVIILLSGGGSALLPAPVSGINLEDKLEVTRFLAGAGAPIEELNLVRRKLSKIKGGGLAAASKAGVTISLIISDVIGDPLEVIASGPTVPTQDTAQAALQILEKYSAASSAKKEPPAAVVNWLKQEAEHETEPVHSEEAPPGLNYIIGNNQVALQAAAGKAEELGYRVISLGSDLEGEAAEYGRVLARQLVELQAESNQSSQPICLLSGGEPTVRLAATDLPRKGGRNQELVLAALQEWESRDLSTLILLSGGTDGEDGPTDAAGGWVDQGVQEQAERLNLELEEYLQINNSYPFLEQTGGLLKTGPTHTNVMDLRVGLVLPEQG